MRPNPTWAKQNWLIALTALSLGFVAVATSLPASVAGESDIQRGRALYSQYCRSCHGVTGTGDGPAASSLKVAPADLTSISKKYSGFPKEKVMDWIDGTKYAAGHGSREMPVWGKKFHRGLAGKGVSGEVQALTEYLKSIQK